MKNYIITEKQVRRLLQHICEVDLKTQSTPVPVPGAKGTTPPAVDGLNPTTPINPDLDQDGDIDADDVSMASTGAAVAGGGGDSPLGPEVAGDDMGMGAGGSAMGGSDPFSTSSADVNANTRVTKWESGASRGKANPIGPGVWDSGASRGAANQIGNTKWSDTVGSQLTRGKGNQLT